MAHTTGATARTVADIMSSPAVTATTAETIAEASDRMGERRVGSVVVVDDERPVGILTERDLVRFAASGADPSATKVSEWMTADPYTVAPDRAVSDAFQSLSEKGYRHIPVVDDGALVGIVSMRDLMKIAQIQPAGRLAGEVPLGLEGVVVAETHIGHVRGQEGFYHYRQYNAVELAEKRTLEDVWHLMFYGELPTLAEREHFIEEVRPFREIPEVVQPLMANVAKLGDPFVPLNGLRSAVSLLGSALDFRPSLDIDVDELRHNAMQVCAVVPTFLTALYRLNQGLEPITPHPELPYAANYLYMMQGEVPTAEHARAVEQYLISTIDHGFNASTFTARVITSTGADLAAAVDRWHRRALRAAARRCAESRARHARRRRHGRERRTLDPRIGRTGRPTHGLRTPCLQDRRPAFDHVAGCRRTAR